MSNVALPVPISSTNYLAKAASTYPRIEKYVDALASHERSASGHNTPDRGRSWWYESEIAEAKQLLAERDQMRRDWAAVSQPASTEQIAVAVGQLLVSFRNLGKDELTLFTQILCEEIGSEQPSIYVLMRTVRRVRRRHKFPDIATVIEEMDKARHAARKNERLLTESAQLEHKIQSAEKQLPEIIKAAAEDEAKWLEELYQRAKESPVNLCPGMWDVTRREALAKEYPPEQFPELWDGPEDDDE